MTGPDERRRLWASDTGGNPADFERLAVRSAAVDSTTVANAAKVWRTERETRDFMAREAIQTEIEAGNFVRLSPGTYQRAK